MIKRLKKLRRCYNLKMFSILLWFLLTNLILNSNAFGSYFSSQRWHCPLIHFDFEELLGVKIRGAVARVKYSWEQIKYTGGTKSPFLRRSREKLILEGLLEGYCPLATTNSFECAYNTCVVYVDKIINIFLCFH